MGITRRRGGMNQVNIPKKGVPRESPLYTKYLKALKEEKPTLKSGKVSDIESGGIPLVNLIGHLTNASTSKDSILLNCQPVGGFEVDYAEINVGKNGNPSKIYERMGEIATKNFIAVTELGELKGVYEGGLKVMIDGLNKKLGNEDEYSILGKVLNEDVEKFDDNAFIIKNKGNTNTELLFINNTNTLKKPGPASSPSNLKFISANGINILNVHLPSDGPQSTTINEFLNTYLPSQEELKEQIPDLIVGDTNITCLKCNRLLDVTKKANDPNPYIDYADPKNDEEIETRLSNRSAIMQEMISAISSIYKKQGITWALLMSTTRVDKIRNGGILTNQQANKKMVGSNEPDGTAIFIKVTGSLDDTFLTDSSNFGYNWILCYNGKFYPTPQQELQPKKSAVKFVHFDEDVDKCLDETSGFLKDRLFIDHTPVQISFNAIQTMNPTLRSVPTWQNVVVLNAGAITCSATNKNWKLNLIPCMDQIKIIDETLFEEMKKILAPTSTKGYLDTLGKEYAKWSITTINVNEIAQLLANAHASLLKIECFKNPTNAMQVVSLPRNGKTISSLTSEQLLSNQLEDNRLASEKEKRMAQFRETIRIKKENNRLASEKAKRIAQFRETMQKKLSVSRGGKHTKKRNRKSKKNRKTRRR
jgi:hypothetical protein